MAHELHGILVPIITPFTRSYEVDREALRSHVRFMIESGVHSIIPCGSTGEFSLLTMEERKKIVEIVIDEANGKIPIIPATTAVRTDDVEELTRHAKDCGAEAVLVAPTYYFKPTERELYEYYKAVARVGLPMILYNIPATVKVDMSPVFMIRLSNDFANIKYVKEATGDVSRVHEIIRLSGGKVTVLCGHDSIALEMFVLGTKGWIPPPANFVPKECVQLYDLAVVRGDFGAARDLYYKFLPLLVLLEGSGKFAQYSKEGVNLIGHPVGSPRRPLLPIDESERDALKKCMSNLG